MEKRTEPSIREVLGHLPLPPRVAIEERDRAPRVVIREQEEDEEDDDPVRLALRGEVFDDDDGEIYRDLLIFGRPGSDSLDAAWKEAPLVFNDRQLVAAADEIITPPPYLVGSGCHDFTKIITALLRRHPGPISFFSLDSSACPGPDLLQEWIDLLSQKTVNRLTVMNISQPQQLDFPLHRLQGDGTLTSLALAFFNLANGLRDMLAENVEASFGALTSLTLAGCALNGESLKAVISCCSVLTTLKIWGSDLTARCDGRRLTISAHHLTTMELLRCRATALTLDTPALCQLSMDVRPARQSWVEVHFGRADLLRELRFLVLDRHRFSFHTSHSVTLQRRKITSLPCMQRLQVRLNMSNAQQSRTLISLLHSTPRLSHLFIRRTDTPNDEEGEPWTTDGALSCRCFADALQYLAVMGYRGGVAELAFMKEVLRCGRTLTEVRVYPHSTLPLSRRDADSHLLKNSPRASATCVINVLQPEGD